MLSEAKDAGKRSGVPWRVIGWGGIAVLLLVPYFIGAPWTVSDYVIAAVLFSAAGGAVELVARRSNSLASLAGAALAVLAALLTVWANLAVGMIESEDNSYNLIFIGILLAALLGAMLVRFKPPGMIWVMVASGAAQVAAGAAGLPVDTRGGILSMGFAGMWLLAAGSFWLAARDRMAMRS